ncbi:hypothetical protein AVEN_115526-1 [Araneus ventricosus]|uniref:Uncharacterized protein n=1 Tax=Araneus ventricosus TaxID=182803 RepID=A0A4Y2CJP8_ARAVE|nr:hypothetical protein AVEN_115526-1 [Araneus ventricosus]
MSDSGCFTASFNHLRSFYSESCNARKTAFNIPEENLLNPRNSEEKMEYGKDKTSVSMEVALAYLSGRIRLRPLQRNAANPLEDLLYPSNSEGIRGVLKEYYGGGGCNVRICITLS